MHEIEAAVTRVREAKAELDRAQNELDDWRKHRHDKAIKIPVVNYDTFRTATGIVPLTEFSGQENIRRGRIIGLQAAVDQAREDLRQLKLKNPIGARVSVDFADCFLPNGAAVRKHGIANGTISATLGPFVEVALAEPLDLLEPENRAVASLFARLDSLRFFLEE